MEHESRRLASRMIGIALEELTRLHPHPDDPPRHDYEVEALNHAKELLVALVEELDKTTGRNE